MVSGKWAVFAEFLSNMNVYVAIYKSLLAISHHIISEQGYWDEFAQLVSLRILMTKSSDDES